MTAAAAKALAGLRRRTAGLLAGRSVLGLPVCCIPINPLHSRLRWGSGTAPELRPSPSCPARGGYRAISMIFQLFRHTPRDDTIASLYGMIVAQAREPVFYQTFGVPDTVNGRFEMVVLHTILLVSRIQVGRTGWRGQGMFDR